MLAARCKRGIAPQRRAVLVSEGRLMLIKVFPPNQQFSAKDTRQLKKQRIVFISKVYVTKLLTWLFVWNVTLLPFCNLGTFVVLRILCVDNTLYIFVKKWA